MIVDVFIFGILTETEFSSQIHFRTRFEQHSSQWFAAAPQTNRNLSIVSLVAAPIRDREGLAIASIGISAPVARFTAEHVEGFRIRHRRIFMIANQAPVATLPGVPRAVAHSC
jgi:hypothetical protein